MTYNVFGGTYQSSTIYTVNRKKRGSTFVIVTLEKHSIFIFFALLQAESNVLHTHVKYVHLT